ncbi:Per1-like protein [Punctularia strigosozonata HHB-11173 SS5]|uniref:Per1-like protein n=1 Tax=Punctularia strigosozonata (strain HHB-11173) TaxID=741275 RepID=UPI00044185E5|nr:Per1-like protein [Punctularia strigosozonata HHB-11173 SS5]EIN07949.1 Per1-like protein [Punctularia strigosozonata HHB-11173 SS5]
MRASPGYVVLLLLPSLAWASSGDRSKEYHDCNGACQSKLCIEGATPLSLPLRLTRWTCVDECKYSCMHQLTDDAIANHRPVEQYYGKWPFWRFAGMQEPASVAFSLLNLWAHARGTRKIQRYVRESHPMRRYYLYWSLVSINAWVWSSVFHTRDLPLTEKLDYFSAALAILYALYIIVIRVFHLYPSEPRNRLTLTSNPESPHPIAHLVWKWTCVLAFLGHVTYLSILPRFDYTYNIIFNLVVGMAHNLLWLLYSMPAILSTFRRFPYRERSYRPSFTGKAAVFVIFTTAATGLELFDFPPWGRVIDAHSLWHLATAPIALFWYNFLVQDARDDGWRPQKLEMAGGSFWRITCGESLQPPAALRRLR